MFFFFHYFFQDEQIDWAKQELSVSEIQHKVKEYNAQINSNLYMVVVSDYSNDIWVFLMKICNPYLSFH